MMIVTDDCKKSHKAAKSVASMMESISHEDLRIFSLANAIGDAIEGFLDDNTQQSEITSPNIHLVIVFMGGGKTR